MNDGEFGMGFSAGTLVAAVIAVIVFYMFENECQKKHNVYDCAATGSLFEPVEVD